MKQSEDLVALLKKVQTTGGLDCDQASVCDYQDMIGHSTQEQLKDLSNDVYIRAFYRVYGLAYGTTEAIKFYMQNSDKVYNILLERDGLKCDLEEMTDKYDHAMLEVKKNFDTAARMRDEWEKEKTEKENIKKDLEKAQAEIIELKAKLYDLITK
jgi:predicted transcriptional regulator